MNVSSQARPNQAQPNQAQQHQASLMRAITGPLVLITLGVLLAMDHLGGISFGRTWPALLIVFGICKLLERAGVRNA